MFIDARTVPESTAIETDVCIIGAGAAGITLAREFIGRPFRVALLESGGLEFENATQTLYAGENVARPYYPLEVCRLRYFGGTTNHWGGFCRPLDEIDFEVRDWVPHSGWPFNRAHLDPFYQRAAVICQLGPCTFGVKHWETRDCPPLPFGGDELTTAIFQNSPPTRFGQVYREEIKRAANISAYLHANVVDIETTETASSVTRLRIACLSGNRFSVSAKLFILATGGIENARLLLLSNRAQSNGLGNQNDLVGRFFMDHPISTTGLVALSGSHPASLYVTHEVHGTPVRGVLCLSPDALRREQMLGCGVGIPRPTSWAGRSKGASSLRALWHAVKGGGLSGGLASHIGNVIADLDDIAAATYEKVFYKDFRHTDYWAEPAPNPDSRVTLIGERDALGKNRVQLAWRLTDRDTRNMMRMHQLLAKDLGRAGLGRLKFEIHDGSEWSPNGSYHHIGTTRMHVDPRNGVVDENCRVHGISNLFIAGSSVFPTAGYANPTLTIVALATRLADHIGGLLT